VCATGWLVGGHKCMYVAQAIVTHLYLPMGWVDNERDL
jgi:hypothetical protein